MSSQQVECPNCGTEFELWDIGGYCPNPECGVQHPMAKDGDTADQGDTGEAEPAGDDIAPPVDETACPSCGETVSDDATFCQFCGSELGDEPEPTPSSRDPVTECPSCGADVPGDSNFCVQCGTELSGGAPADTQPADGSTTGSSEAGAHGPGDPGSDTTEIALDVMGERLVVGAGDRVGSEIRRAMVAAGGDSNEAQYVHREHIEFDVRDDGVYLIDHGQNSTRVNGQSLTEGDEVQVADGDVVELAGVVDATVEIT